jgi:hypothetical protein
MALVVAGGLWLGMASAADAQVSVAVGNPYYGGFAVGAPYVGGYYGVPYGGVAGVVPGATYYSSGYYGVAPVAPVGVGVFPSYGYRAFYGVAPYPRYGFYGPGRFGFGGFRRRAWGYW